MLKFLKTVREALSSHGHNYTEGDVGQAILLLAIPMVLEMIMESVFAVVDVFFVGKLGSEAVAVVGLTESLLIVLYTIAMGLSIGAAAVVARRVGEGNAEGASHAAGQAVLLGMIVSAVLGVFGVIFAPDLLTLMGADASITELGTGYARIMLGGNVVIMLLYLVNGVFRGAGDAAIAMRALWLANGLNLILCPCFIFGIGPFPELGVTGAAVATTLGRGIGVVYVLSRLFNGKGRLQSKLRDLGFDPAVMAMILRLSGQATFQMFIGSASWIVLVKINSQFGPEALAGYTIGIRVILFALFPAFGLGNAAATMVGQSLGAKNPERAEKAVWIAGFYNLCFLGAIGLLFALFPSAIVSYFTSDPKTAEYAADCLRYVAFGFAFYAYGIVFVQAFNGAGDTKTPTWVNFASFWAFEIPLAWILATRVGWGPHGIFVAILLAFSFSAVLSAYLFRRGRWKRVVV